MPINELLGVIILWSGVIFCVLGIIGLIRFPDVYCRIHASGKVATVGLIGLLAGTSILMPETTLKAAALALFVVICSPIASHSIAKAAYQHHLRLEEATNDSDLS
ncbi:MAG: monovalent cation/H(+) antiporter subunit G [Anaerolineae bacterium]|nr:monovalent cation/H(+) antiporter subunit G [Anaerolineae bacterium]